MKYLSYEMLLARQKKLWAFTGGALLGMLVFLYLYGIAVLDVHNTGWLMVGSDLTQQYIGWEYFKATDWTFPLGMINNLLYPGTISIMYTDSIPLFAFFFKLFPAVREGTFQYFGIWGLLSYALQGGFGALIISKYTKKNWLAWTLSLFFSFLPVMVQRMFFHTALGSQFMVLAAISIWMYQDHFRSTYKMALVWGAMGALSILIQSYFTLMVGGFILGLLLEELLNNRNWKRTLAVFFSFCVGVLVPLYLINGLVAEQTYAAGGFGKLSANLNTFFNSNMGYSNVFLPLPEGSGQYEGFAYLGAGMLLLVAIAIILRIAGWKRGVRLPKERLIHRVSLGIVYGVFLFLAVTPIVMWEDSVLFTIPVPQFFWKAMDHLRSSGRFIWCDMYLIMIFALRTVLRMNRKRTATGLLCACLCLQFFDLNPMRTDFTYPTYSTKTTWSSPILVSDQWDELTNDYNHIVILPKLDFAFFQNALRAYSYAQFAYEHDMTISYFNTERYVDDDIDQAVEDHWQSIADGTAPTDTLYVLDAWDLVNRSDVHLNLYLLDGQILGSVNPIDGLAAYTQTYTFALEQFMLEGGTVTDDGWEVDTSGYVHGPYEDLMSGNYQVTVTGQNLDQATFEVCYDVGATYADVKLQQVTATQAVYTFTLDSDVHQIEFLTRNYQDAPILFQGLTLSRVSDAGSE